MRSDLYAIIYISGTDFKVRRRSDGVDVFFGTRDECREWIEQHSEEA